MFVSDLLRLDTVLLLLMEPEMRPSGAGELADALAELGLDVPTHNVNRELRSMQTKGLVTCTGYSLRHGRHRMRTYELTESGRATTSRRRSLLNAVLYNPPAVSAPEEGLQQAEGWS
jgi:DNA-binding PadR family transcriptional regulator